MMRFFIAVFPLFLFHICWSQSSLPADVEMPYNPDSIAARRIAYILVKEYNDFNYGKGPFTSGLHDSITFYSNGAIAEHWQKGHNDSAYVPFEQKCDSLNAFYYTRCDSAGRVIENRRGSTSFHYRYNSKGDIAYAATIDRPVESAETVWSSRTEYDSVGRPIYVYSCRGLLGYNYSTKSLDTHIRACSYSKYVYANGRLIEILEGLDSLGDPYKEARTEYIYEGNKLVRVEVPRTTEHKRKKKQVPYIGRFWTVSYGYRE